MPRIPGLPAARGRGRPTVARPRLFLALAGSVAVHLGLIAAIVPGVFERSGPAAVPRLEVRLVTNGATTMDASAAEPAVPPAPAEGVTVPAPPARSRARAPVAQPAPAQAEPRYYAAHELDVFPRLAQARALDLQAASGHAVAQRLRLELLIDAAGRVRRISVLDAGQPESAVAAARAQWKDARFDPARRSGRAVASRIEIEIDHGAAGAAR